MGERGSGLHGSPRRRATIPLSPDISDSALMMGIHKQGAVQRGDTRLVCTAATVARPGRLRSKRDGEKEKLGWWWWWYCSKRVKTAWTHFYTCVTVKTPKLTHEGVESTEQRVSRTQTQRDLLVGDRRCCFRSDCSVKIVMAR